MNFGPIKYTKGHKHYQLSEDVSGDVPIRPKGNIATTQIELTRDGYMTIKKGFSWDGASGPTINTKNTQVPSAVHDAFCWLIRHNYLPKSVRSQADAHFYTMLIERGMWKLRAKIWYRGVRIGSLRESKPKRIFTVK